MFIAKIARREIDGWNERILDETDILAFCRPRKIKIEEDADVPFGKIRFLKKGRAEILINPNLSPGMRLWVLWHECAHFMLHDPLVSHFSEYCRDKNDREANRVAAVALIPRSLLETASINDLLDFGFPPALIKLRWKIYQTKSY